MHAISENLEVNTLNTSFKITVTMLNNGIHDIVIIFLQ